MHIYVCGSHIMARCGLDGPGFQPGWGWNFPAPSRPTSRSTHPSVQWVKVLFAGDKAAEAWRLSPTPISAGVVYG